MLLASMLLDTLLSYLTSADHLNVKAVYLHVLTSNGTAIRFYERRHFKVHSYLPYYYSIKGQPRDGYSYVLYINGGEPPWSVIYPLHFYIYYWDIVIYRFSTENRVRTGPWSAWKYLKFITGFSRPWNPWKTALFWSRCLKVLEFLLYNKSYDLK